MSNNDDVPESKPKSAVIELPSEKQNALFEIWKLKERLESINDRLNSIDTFSIFVKGVYAGYAICAFALIISIGLKGYAWLFPSMIMANMCMTRYVGYRTTFRVFKKSPRIKWLYVFINIFFNIATLIGTVMFFVMQYSQMQHLAALMSGDPQVDATAIWLIKDFMDKDGTPALEIPSLLSNFSLQVGIFFFGLYLASFPYFYVKWGAWFTRFPDQFGILL